MANFYSFNLVAEIESSEVMLGFSTSVDSFRDDCMDDYIEASEAEDEVYINELEDAANVDLTTIINNCNLYFKRCSVSPSADPMDYASTPFETRKQLDLMLTHTFMCYLVYNLLWSQIESSVGDALTDFEFIEMRLSRKGNVMVLCKVTYSGTIKEANPLTLSAINNHESEYV